MRRLLGISGISHYYPTSLPAAWREGAQEQDPRPIPTARGRRARDGHAPAPGALPELVSGCPPSREESFGSGHQEELRGLISSAKQGLELVDPRLAGPPSRWVGRPAQPKKTPPSNPVHPAAATGFPLLLLQQDPSFTSEAGALLVLVAPMQQHNHRLSAAFHTIATLHFRWDPKTQPSPAET